MRGLNEAASAPMLQWIRQGAGSWIVKGFLGVLIVSFAVWGIGDIFSGRSVTTAVKVGSVRVSEAELADAFRRELRRLQQVLGPSVTADQARQFGLDRQVLATTISRAVLDARAADFKLVASDDTVRRMIQTMPEFKGPAGDFDRIQYEQVLRANDMSEARLVAQMKADIVRRQIEESVYFGLAVPRALAETVHSHRGERRVAELFVVANDSIRSIPAPDAAALDAFHKANAERFTAPEYRKLSVLTVEPGDLAKEIDVSDADLAAAYDERHDEFVTEERRDVLQMVTPDEAKAREVARRVAAGEDFVKVASAVAGLKESDLALGEITRDTLPGTLGETVFALKPKTVSEPVKSSFGWNVYLVRAVTPGVKLSLADVRDQLRSEVRLSRATDRVATIGNELQDALAGGATLEEAAQRFGAPIRVVEAVDNRGRDPKGNAIPLPASDRFLTDAFAVATGATGDLGETSTGGLYVVRVDSVTPSALKPLDAIRGEVVAAWTVEEKARRAAADAEAKAEAIRSGKTAIADAARSAGAKLSTTLPLTRDANDADPNVGPILIGKLFAAKAGDIVTAPTPKGDGTVVARLKDVQAVDMQAEAVALKSLQEKLSENLGQDLLAQFQRASREEIGVETNETLVERALAGDSRGG